jgi:hypothetical protein
MIAAICAAGAAIDSRHWKVDRRRLRMVEYRFSNSDRSYSHRLVLPRTGHALT